MMSYRDPAACLEALAQLKPVNVTETHTVLTTMLEGLLAGDPAPAEHLQVLEAARLPLELVQDELAKRYAAHPLPPDSAENQTLQRVVALWQTMHRSYVELTRRASTDPALDDQHALLAHRRVAYAGQSIFEFFRAHRAVPEGLWAELHHSYAQTESEGLAQTRVPDPLITVWNVQSPGEAYVSALLVDLANPYGRSKREFNWVCRWAQRFAPYCGLRTGADAEKHSAYALDLDSDHALRPIASVEPGSAALRWFDGQRLGDRIRSTLDQVKQGTTPEELGLGADCSPSACAKLLVSLYRPWGMGSVGRRFRRRSSAGRVELTGNWDAIGFHVQGKAFVPPERPAQPRSLRSDIRLMTFGERAEEIDTEESAQNREERAARLGYTCEKWNLLDQSVGGFRLDLKHTRERLEHRQLVGLRPSDSARFLLGLVSWLLYRDDGTMQLGISLLDGLPEVIAVRTVLPDGRREGSYQQAFLLPEVQALNKPASLVLAAGCHSTGGLLEKYDMGQVSKVRLTKLLLRGTNFDQAGFEAVTSAP